jgi:hypothetical protein
MGLDIITRRELKGITIKPGYNIIGIYKGTSEPYVLWCFNGNYEFGHREPRGIKGNCLWCQNEFTSNISRGPRAQKFCSSKCKNNARDLRRGLKPRMIKGKLRLYLGHFKKLALEFKGDIDKLRLPDEVRKKVMEVRKREAGNIKSKD